MLPEAGFNYHDFIIARRPDGKIKAVDIYVFLTGEMFSQTVRRVYIQAAASSQGGLVSKLTGADQKYAKHFQSFADIAAAGQSGDPGKVLALYKALPDELKKDKSILILRIQAAQKSGIDDEYSAAIEDFRKEFPADACIDMISIDYYLLKKKFREALDCVDRLDRAVQGDPYLQTTRLNIHMEQNDLVAAREDARKALEADPSLVDAYWGLVTISLSEKKFDETLQTLRTLRDKFKITIGDLATISIYKEFTESPQYQEWLKDKPAAEPNPPADRPKP